MMRTASPVRPRVVAFLCLVLLAMTVVGGFAERRVWGWRPQGTNPYPTDPWWDVLDTVSPLFFSVERLSDSVYVIQPTSGTLPEMEAYTLTAQGKGVQVHPIVQFCEENGVPYMATFFSRQDAKDTLVAQIAAVCDTLEFDGICIDFEYPRADDDSLFTAFLKQLSGSIPSDDTLSVAVPPPNGSFTGAFWYDSLAVELVSGVHFVLEMNYHKFPVPEAITGPTTPAWWWIEAADTTRGYQNRPGYGLGMPSFGVDYRISATASDSSALRARVPETQALNRYPFGTPSPHDLIRKIVTLSHTNRNNNDDNYPVQWSTATSGGVGDSCVYLPYTSGTERRQYWHSGPESFTPFLHALNDSPQINNVAVWVMGTFVDTLLYSCFREWDASQEPTVSLTIDSLWMDNDTLRTDNGPVDNPWTLEPDTLYFKEHTLAPDTTLGEAQSDSCVLTDEERDSLRSS